MALPVRLDPGPFAHAGRSGQVHAEPSNLDRPVAIATALIRPRLGLQQETELKRPTHLRGIPVLVAEDVS